MSLEQLEKDYNNACREARIANDAAHDVYPPISIGGLKKVKIERAYKKLPADTYNTDKTFLALVNGNWVIGYVHYYASQERFLFDWFWGVNTLQVEHLQQLYEIDIPEVPDRIIPEPLKPAELIALEEEEY